jgi:hypothetical protein
MTIINFITIDKNFYLLNKANKEILEQNATKQSVLAINAYISDIAYDILRRIVKRQMNLSANETLLSKFIERADICTEEEIHFIENMLLDIETELIKDTNTSIQNVLEKRKFNPQLN